MNEMKHRDEQPTTSLPMVELLGVQPAETIAKVAEGESAVLLVSERGDKAVALSVDLYDALQETIEVLSDSETTRAISRGIADLEADRTHTHDEVFGSKSKASTTRT